MPSNPVAETVASLIPRAKEELTELVAFRSVADFDQFPRSESEGAARWVADALRAEGFQDVALLDTPTAPSPSTATCRGPRARRPSSSTRTTTYSRRWTRPPGCHRRSS